MIVSRTIGTLFALPSNRARVSVVYRVVRSALPRRSTRLSGSLAAQLPDSGSGGIKASFGLALGCSFPPHLDMSTSTTG